MAEHAIKNKISEWPQTIHTKLPVTGLSVKVDPKEGTTTLEFASLEFTRTNAATIVLKGDNFDRRQYADIIFAMGAPNTMLEHVTHLGDGKYVAMIVLHNRFAPIHFEAEEATLLWDVADTSDRTVLAVFEHYRRGGWGGVFAGMLPYWPENYYTRPRITHPYWHWVRERNSDSQHPYPHVDSEMRLVRVSPDPDDEGYVEYEITQSDFADAVALRKIRESISAGGYSRYRSPSNDEYENISWLGRYGVFDLHHCDYNLVASAVDDTGATVFETIKLGTRDPFAPDWYWEALTRLTSVDRDAREGFFNLRNCKN